ncbi:sulfotransferase [Devosia sp. A16]|uniref:sulfotransferase n=1 Tax=Devosia sp. A16 TaxID=1736675 RepID=UPI0006D7D635|nr:sulfotransferase [Devosia sp. A16]
MLDSLCLITGPRTGANHLMQLGGNFAELKSFPELFGSLAERIEPDQVLDRAVAATRAEHKRVLVFKLWHDTLEPETVEQLVLSWPGMRVIFVVRRQIDAYVSWCKAIHVHKWQDVDTSAVRLTLDIADFAAWLEAQERWYARWRNWLDRRFLPAPILRYETDIDQRPEGALRRFAAAAAQVGVTLRVPTTLTTTGLVRQDRVKAAADKVDNWPAFSKALVTQGLEKRAFGYPV